MIKLDVQNVMLDWQKTYVHFAVGLRRQKRLKEINI